MQTDPRAIDDRIDEQTRREMAEVSAAEADAPPAMLRDIREWDAE